LSLSIPIMLSTSTLVIRALPTGATAEDIDKCFLAPKPERARRIEEILETLAALGKARELAADRYIAM
jgi:hypothetical protein